MLQARSTARRRAFGLFADMPPQTSAYRLGREAAEALKAQNIPTQGKLR
jgi:hypothetical protein